MGLVQAGRLTTSNAGLRAVRATLALYALATRLSSLLGLELHLSMDFISPKLDATERCLFQSPLKANEVMVRQATTRICEFCGGLPHACKVCQNWYHPA